MTQLCADRARSDLDSFFRQTGSISGSLSTSTVELRLSSSFDMRVSAMEKLQNGYFKSLHRCLRQLSKTEHNTTSIFKKTGIDTIIIRSFIMFKMKKMALAATAICVALSGQVSAKTLKLGMGDPIDSDQGALAVRFQELLEAYSGGEMQVELFPSGSLGSETEMLQNVRMGSLDFALVGIGNVTPFAPKLGALTLPYMIESTSDAVKVTSGPINDRWKGMARESGFEILSWTYSNFRYLTNSVRPVTQLSDIKGMKVRVPQNKIMLATYEAWGASPIAMAWPEVFAGLQQGVIDGQDNPYIVNYTMKFQEVQDHLAEVHYNYSLQPLMAGVKGLSKFTEEEQEWIKQAGIEAQMYSLMFQLEEAGKAKQGMIDAGVKVTTISDEDQWIKLAKDNVWPAFYDQVGGKEFVDELQAQLGR